MPRRRALPTLDRMRALTALLGDPQDSIPSIHVTGTNGKGSTVGHGHRPAHGQGPERRAPTPAPTCTPVNERLARNGEPIDDEALTEVADRAGPARAAAGRAADPLRAPDRRRPVAGSPTEAVDAWWSRSDSAGTWDCTNVVDGDVAVLTNVSFDHTEVLGPTLEDIAGDKAGIIKPGSRVVVGETWPLTCSPSSTSGPRRSGRRRSGSAAGTSAATPTRSPSAAGWSTLRTPGGRYEDVLVPLHGAHQGEQRRVRPGRGGGLLRRRRSTPDVVDEGFAAVRVPGRLEVLGRRPLLLVDGAHNVAGMAALGAALIEEFAVDGSDRGRRRHARRPRPVGHAGAARAPAGVARGGRLRARLAARHAGRRRGRGGARTRPRGRTRRPTSRDALRVARGMVDADGLVRRRRFALRRRHARVPTRWRPSVPWEDAGR